MRKMKRAPRPTWLTDEQVQQLLDFTTIYGGTLRVHNHRKTIARW